MSAAKQPVIRLKDVVKKYGLGDAEQRALDAVNLRVDAGEFIAIMGPSGCGKTTLLNLLGLLDCADEGEYLLDGTEVEGLSDARRSRIRATQLGIVFQQFNLIERMNVIENVALPLTYNGVGRVKRLKAASKVLASFHLAEREYYMPGQLSGGQMQRVAIARALVNQPSLILADEPTGNLDTENSVGVLDLFDELHADGMTLLVITHEDEVSARAQRRVRISDGELMELTA